MYAQDGSELQAKISKIVEMGFDEDGARKALECKHFDEIQAVEFLLNQS